MTEISLTEILVPNPEIKEGLHPHAAERYAEWRMEVFQELVQLIGDGEKVNVDADLDTYLNDADKAWAKKYREGILEWLRKCTNIGKGFSLYPYATWVISDMSRLKSLIKKAYEARRKKIEWEERWDAAYKALNTPVDDAKKYLNNEEYEKYLKSINGAVLAYMEKREAYKDDRRSTNYRDWLRVINRKQEEEQQQIVDNLAAREFNNSLSKHIAGLKSKLNNRPRDLQNYFTAKIQDKRYTGHNFDYVLDDEQERVFDTSLVRIANDKLKQIIPPDLLEFIEIPSTYYRLYFPLPSISYSFEGVPCLNFSFEIFATAYAEVLLKPKVKRFGICSFNLPAGKEGNVLVPLEKPKLLGYFCILLTPEDLGGYIFWQVIPLVLVKGLLNGETKPNGVTISAASDDSITYKVQKFKEEVNIPDKFAGYLKNIGSFDGMFNMGIVIEKVAKIVRSELGEFKVEQGISPQKEKIERKDTGKARAFRLFDEGKRPSDREVKALKINPQILYRYYQEWKKIIRQ